MLAEELTTGRLHTRLVWLSQHIKMRQNDQYWQTRKGNIAQSPRGRTYERFKIQVNIIRPTQKNNNKKTTTQKQQQQQNKNKNKNKNKQKYTPKNPKPMTVMLKFKISNNYLPCRNWTLESHFIGRQNTDNNDIADEFHYLFICSLFHNDRKVSTFILLSVHIQIFINLEIS